jgi:E3 ubiquitin-protein ligase BAH
MGMDGCTGTMQSFQPKLVLTVRGRDGLPLDLGLSDETRQSLERLLRQRAIRPSATDKRASIVSAESDSSDESSPPESLNMPAASISNVSNPELVKSSGDSADAEPVSTIEIPLCHDSEFFRDLAAELSALGKVQSRAAETIKSEIVTIGDSVTVVATPHTGTVKRSDLYPWREIFRVYLETGIFFSNLEMEAHRERSVEDAQARLDKFSHEVERLGLRKAFKQRNSHLLFNRFVAVNEEVLKVLRFQAINKMAMTKILKSSFSVYPPEYLRKLTFRNQNLISALPSAPAKLFPPLLPLTRSLRPSCQGPSVSPCQPSS